MDRSLQETFAPEGRCFGCGPKNARGLRLRSFPEGADACVARWLPEPFHEAFDGVLCGGICGTVLDCHSNWSAAWHLMRRTNAATPPCTVTAEFAVKLRRPTPMDEELVIRSKVLASDPDRATVSAVIEAAGVVTATCEGIFVAVRPGHPAYHRW